MKARFLVVFTLVLLTAVFSASALTANLNAPLGQQAGSFAASVFSFFGSDDRAKKQTRAPLAVKAELERQANERGPSGGDTGSMGPEVSFANAAPITIPTSGNATPYPSSINVSGLVGSVATVTVTINGYSHSYPDDVSMLLTGPTGQAFLLSSGAGDSTDAVNINYTLSDAGVTALPGGGTWANGTYRPAGYYTGENFGAPAPGTVYSHPGPAGGNSATLNGTFGGSNPNGNWNLFVVDFVGGDSGSISGGWSIDITTQNCAAPPANMVAWYPGEVSPADIIGDPPNDGAPVGALLYGPGRVGNGFALNGTNAYVQVPPSASLNVGAAGGFSIDAWINPANSTAGPVVEWNNGAATGVHMWTSFPAAGQIYVNVVDTVGINHAVNTTSAPVVAGSNNHVAFTYDKLTGNVFIYHNGVAQPTSVATLGTGFTPQTGAGYSMFLGHRPAPAATYYAGVLDEVEVFSRALTGAEVASINTAGAVGKCHVSFIQFDTAAQGIGENAGSVVTTLKRVGANDSTATVAYNTANGTATGGGVDYGNASTSIVTFGIGERTQTVTIPIIDDAIDEADETFTAAISLPTGAGVAIGTPSSQTITITDNDAVPVMTINNATGTEGTPPGAGGSATFTVTKTGQTTFASSVVVTPTSGTATGGASCSAGVDFINTATTLNFPASTTTDTQNVTVNFCPDSSVEGDEAFTMALTPTGATAGAAGNGTIRDDDSTVQFTAAAFSGTEGTIAGPGLTPFSITVSRTGTGTGLPAATVDASTIQVGGTANGENSCAIAGADYVVVSGQTLSWTPGDTTTKTLIVNVCADSKDENNENFNSQLSNAIGTQIGAQATTVTTINDDDNPPSFALTPSTTTVAEGANATYTVTRSGNETQLSTTVTWTATSGTATGGTDYSPQTGTVTFAAGTGGTQTFTIGAIDDVLFEGSENFTVALTAASNGSAFSGSNTTTITDNDAAPTVAINDVSQVELNSGQSAFIFTITRTGDAQANQIITFSTQDGGGATAATAPSDYTAIPSDTVTFTQGQTSRQVAVIVNGDVIFEDDETFRVNLTGFNFGSATDGTGLGTILNDDAAPVFQIGADPAAVAEGNTGTTAITFTINKVGLTELTSIVTANTVDGTALSTGTTASGGNDYQALVNAAVATFAPGDTTKTFTVLVNGDTIYEVPSPETFTVNLSNVTNGTFGADISAIGSINNDDNAPNFSIAGTTTTTVEGGSVTATVTRSFTSPTTGTAVNSTVTCGRSTISSNSTIHAQTNDFTSSSSTLTFTPADTTQVCTVATTQDSAFEGSETFNVTLAGSTNFGTISGGPIVMTITNDDACSFTTSSVSQNEGNAGTSNFVHTVTKACTYPTEAAGVGFVNYAGIDGTATSPSDYTEIIPGQLAFLAAETSKPLPVSVNGDLIVESDETYNVCIFGSGACSAVVATLGATVNGVPVPNGACGTATCGMTNGTGTIVNDDGVPISITGTITNFGGGAAAGVTVNLTGANTATTTTNASGQYTFSGLLSGGNFTVTPVAPAGTVASPTSRTFTGITTNQTNQNFVLYQSGAIPRTLNVINSYTNPGSPVTVPITLTAQGDEASLSFSLSYNPAILSGPTLACGTDSGAGCTLLANTSVPGQIGVSVDPQSGAPQNGLWQAGTRIVVTVTFNTAATGASNTPVNFTDVPTLRRTSDAGSNPLPTVYNNGFVVFAQGLESDVATRNAGDGSVTAPDVVQTRRFVTNLDTPATNFNEFQRADSAPGATRGDGLLGASDVIQARRYSTGLDPTQAAGGPFVAATVAPNPEGFAKGDAPEVGRVLRLLNASGAPGSQVNVCIEIDSQGDEAAIQTSVNFDQTKLSISGVSSPAVNPDVTLGTGVAAGTSLTVNGTQAASGRIGFLIDSSNVLQAGTRQIICLRFTIAAGAPQGNTPVTFGNQPVAQSLSDAGGNPLTATNENGNVNILGPTAAGVTVSGRVMTSAGAGLRGATVTLIDSEGNRRTATTSTFGYYQFDDVEAGSSYVMAVTSRRFRFTPRTVQVLDNLSDVDFIGQE